MKLRIIDDDFRENLGRIIGPDNRPAFIAGGFVVANVTKLFEPNDIDIFVLKNLHFTDDDGYIQIPYAEEVFPEPGWIRIESSDNTLYTNLNAQSVRWKNPKYPDLDVIFVPDTNLTDLFLSFDINVCKMAINIDTGEVGIDPTAVQDVYHRTLSCSRTTEITTARAKKYQERLGREWYIVSFEGYTL